MAILRPFSGIRIHPPYSDYIVPQPTLEERERYIRLSLSSGQNLTGTGHVNDDEEMTRATDELLAKLRKEYGFAD